MMDPYNIAICFGPTLVPVPEDKDQVQYQNQVNDLIKNIITYNEEIFPNDGGCVYEKFLSDEVDEKYASTPLSLNSVKLICHFSYSYAEDLKMAEDGDSEVFLYGSEDGKYFLVFHVRYSTPFALNFQIVKVSKLWPDMITMRDQIKNYQ